MSRKWRVIIISIASLALIIAGFALRPDLSPITVAAEPIGIDIPFRFFPDFGFPVTNSLLTTWIAMLLLALFAVWVRSNIQTIPGRKQSLIEMLVETTYNLVVGVAGEKWASAFFPLVMTIFLFVLLSNLTDLLTPVLAAVGVNHHTEHGVELIPLLRSPSTDLNFTLALALVSVGFTQYYGLRANGLLGYLGKFFNVRGFIKCARLLGKGKIKNALGALFMAIIDFFIGIIELISEFAKIISFSFRLFGNIFAGEVLLIVIPFLLPFLVPLPFLGLELFVSFIQAFVFAILTLAFMKMATLSHSEGEH